MTNLDNNILKELDRQNIDGRYIAMIMKYLNNRDKKNLFLSYMISCRNILLTKYDIITFIKEELNNE